LLKKTLLLQVAGAVRLGFGFLRTGVGFGQGSFGLRQFGAQGICLQDREHIAALNPVAHVHTHLGDLQAIGLGPHNGFLPSGQVAVGADFFAPDWLFAAWPQ